LRRVYANPCYYANLLFAEFAGAALVRTELQTPQERAPFVLPDLKRWTNNPSFGAVDALASVSTNGTLLISLVHRGTAGPIRLSVNVDGFASQDQAQASTLSAVSPWEANTLQNPQSIAIHDAQLKTQDGRLNLTLQPFSLAQIRLTLEVDSLVRSADFRVCRIADFPVGEA
jgi:alpha-L-arabinofuranosidase